MVAENLKPALRAALRFHEIGNDTPYRLSFAGKGQSGGSYGAMQGDLAAGQAFVKQTLRDALDATGVAQAKIDALLATLSVAHKTSPLGAADTKLIDDALVASSGLVDQMDERIAAEVYRDTDKCTTAATAGHRTIEPAALLYMALWINMTGAPTKILDWLRGGDVGNGIPVLGPVATVPAIEGYLLKQKYYIENPGNFPHMGTSVGRGVALLP